MVRHELAPVYDENSRVLVLGTFPSVKSRETGFYYGHKQNRFWRVLSRVFDDALPAMNDEKQAFLIKHGVALWDVVAQCDIEGSMDADIKRPEANDIGLILGGANIKAIFANGQTAYKLYMRLIYSQTGIKIIPLPSTSPANAGISFDALAEKWLAVKEQSAI